jgi:hypothetical protein
MQVGVLFGLQESGAAAGHRLWGAFLPDQSVRKMHELDINLGYNARVIKTDRRFGLPRHPL